MCSDFLNQLRSHRRHFVNSRYVYVCSLALNMFKTIERAADCEIRSVIRFLNARNVLPCEIHYQICQVFDDNAMSDAMVRKWVRMFNKDERTCTMRRKVGVHLWWVMIWCVRSTKECVTTDVSQFLICPCTFLIFQGLYDIVSNHLGWLTSQAAAFYVEGTQNLVPRCDKCLNNGGECVEK